MQFKMSDNSLFAMLLRSPWWLSFVIALLLGLGGGPCCRRAMSLLLRRLRSPS